MAMITEAIAENFWILDIHKITGIAVIKHLAIGL
jgi:hypothetical protein